MATTRTKNNGPVKSAPASTTNVEAEQEEPTTRVTLVVTTASGKVHSINQGDFTAPQLTQLHGMVNQAFMRSTPTRDVQLFEPSTGVNYHFNTDLVESIEVRVG